MRPSAEHVSDQVQDVQLYIRPSGEHVFIPGAGRTLGLVQSVFRTRCRMYIRPGAGCTSDVVEGVFKTLCRVSVCGRVGGILLWDLLSCFA
jgi:hypothetical protein